MSDTIKFAKGQKFQNASDEEKISLIKSDLYNLLIKYVRGRVNYVCLQNGVNELSNLGLLGRSELITFLNKKVNYEAYQAAIGRSEAEIEKIRARVNKIKEEE
ncbi:MAG: hypothetical protein AAFY91_14345 [Bacteroidota bacterium]